MLRSIGLTLVDTLDDMIQEGRIEPQLAMKVVSRFDKAASEVLADKVKARLIFKVGYHLARILLIRLLDAAHFVLRSVLTWLCLL